MGAAQPDCRAQPGTFQRGSLDAIARNETAYRRYVGGRKTAAPIQSRDLGDAAKKRNTCKVIILDREKPIQSVRTRSDAGEGLVAVVHK